MTSNAPDDTQVRQKLTQHAESMQAPEKHLSALISVPNRLQDFSLKGAGVFYDFSRQRVDSEAMALLFELATTCGSTAFFKAMVHGRIVNTSEGRAALHTASRAFSRDSLVSDGVDVIAEVRRVQEDIRSFSEGIRKGTITGSTGKPFRHVVVIGIGGSYLGTEFVSRALGALSDGSIQMHYLSNVDIDNFGEIADAIDPEVTLWINISKSFTTAETMANARQAASFITGLGLDPNRHFVTITSKGSPGDDPERAGLGSFHMFDFIGGRYSVTSAVGAVPLSIYLGYDVFERFLRGAGEMDTHALNAPVEKNLPLVAALIAVWNHSFLGLKSQAIIPYASLLQKLAPHVQQLHMESNGKSVTRDGAPMKEPSGMIIFGEPGTNAQHSFFQLAHQGLPFAIDFIGVIRPQYEKHQSLSQGVTNHQELWSNLISQARALAIGKEDNDPARRFSGNRPSSTIILDDLSPENVGRLLSFYEARTVFEATIWGNNPFDQFGVELGKNMASDVRKEIAARNADSDYDFADLDPIRRYYLDMLFRGKTE